jgi:hypothetical protein
MTTQQTAINDAEGRAAFADGLPYYPLLPRLQAGWKAAATEYADKARRERLLEKPESRDPWDKDPI